MSVDLSEPLSPEAELALAWSGPKVRGALSLALQLDRRLARIVGRTTEPVLGQMRLAWWREALGKPVAERPRGDVVLDGIGQHWAGREAALVAMVDGWEALVTAETLGKAEAEAFGAQRGAFFAALGDELAPAAAVRLAAAGLRWALADAAAAVADEDERAVLVAAGLALGVALGRVPRALRGLAVLDALARRALARGGRPLMEGRGASLVAFKAAIF
jgi:15-cis-phytoene synthase